MQACGGAKVDWWESEETLWTGTPWRWGRRKFGSEEILIGAQIFPAELLHGRARNLLLKRVGGPNVTVEPFEHKRAKAEHRAEFGLPAISIRTV